MAGGFANEHQFVDMDYALTREGSPALASDHEAEASFLVEFSLRDGEVRNVGPRFVAMQYLVAKPIMQFAHAVGCALDLNENGRSGGQESFNLAKLDVEWDDVATGIFEELDSGGLRAAELARREDGEMRRDVWHRRMEFLAKLFNEVRDWAVDVAHQRIT